MRTSFPTQYPVLRKVGLALLITLAYYFSMMYINFGFIVWPKGLMLIEMAGNFTLILSLLWMHENVSAYFNGPALRKLHPFSRNALEALLITFFTLALALITVIAPIFLIDPDLPFPYDRLRAGFTIIVTLSLFFYYFVEREQGKKKLRQAFLRSEQLQKESFQAQLEALKQQVNPHFLFNSLNVLSSLIYKDPDKAVEYVRQLSEVYRAFLDNSNKQLVSLREELALAEAYGFLLKTRFGQKLQIEQQLGGKFLDWQLPAGALQTLLENAIKHNGFSEKKPLQINLEMKEERLQIRNKLQPRLAEVPSSGIGLRNLKARYRYLGLPEPLIEQTKEEFIVQLPLLNAKEHANSHY